MKFGGLHFKDHPVEAAASTEVQLTQADESFQAITCTGINNQ